MRAHGTHPIQELRMSDNDRHVVPHADGGWDVKAPHAERASSHHDTQAEAIDRAREIIGNAGGGELVTHGMDGRIRESDTVAAARRDFVHTVDQPAVSDGIALPVDPPTTDRTQPAPDETLLVGQTEASEHPSIDRSSIDPREEPSSDAMPGEESSAGEEEEDPKPTLGDKVKSLLHLSSD